MASSSASGESPSGSEVVCNEEAIKAAFASDSFGDDCLQLLTLAFRGEHNLAALCVMLLEVKSEEKLSSSIRSIGKLAAREAEKKNDTPLEWDFFETVLSPLLHRKLRQFCIYDQNEDDPPITPLRRRQPSHKYRGSDAGRPVRPAVRSAGKKNKVPVLTVNQALSSHVRGDLMRKERDKIIATSEGKVKFIQRLSDLYKSIMSATPDVQQLTSLQINKRCRQYLTSSGYRVKQSVVTLEAAAENSDSDAPVDHALSTNGCTIWLNREYSVHLTGHRTEVYAAKVRAIAFVKGAPEQPVHEAVCEFTAPGIYNHDSKIQSSLRTVYVKHLRLRNKPGDTRSSKPVVPLSLLFEPLAEEDELVEMQRQGNSKYDEDDADGSGILDDDDEDAPLSHLTTAYNMRQRRPATSASAAPSTSKLSRSRAKSQQAVDRRRRRQQPSRSPTPPEKCRASLSPETVQREKAIGSLLQLGTKRQRGAPTNLDGSRSSSCSIDSRRSESSDDDGVATDEEAEPAVRSPVASCSNNKRRPTMRGARPRSSPQSPEEVMPSRKIRSRVVGNAYTRKYTGQKSLKRPRRFSPGVSPRSSADETSNDNADVDTPPAASLAHPSSDVTTADERLAAGGSTSAAVASIQQPPAAADEALQQLAGDTIGVVQSLTATVVASTDEQGGPNLPVIVVAADADQNPPAVVTATDDNEVGVGNGTDDCQPGVANNKKPLSNIPLKKRPVDPQPFARPSSTDCSTQEPVPSMHATGEFDSLLQEVANLSALSNISPQSTTTATGPKADYWSTVSQELMLEGGELGFTPNAFRLNSTTTEEGAVGFPTTDKIPSLSGTGNSASAAADLGRSYSPSTTTPTNNSTALDSSLAKNSSAEADNSSAFDYSVAAYRSLTTLPTAESVDENEKSLPLSHIHHGRFLSPSAMQDGADIFRFLTTVTVRRKNKKCTEEREIRIRLTPPDGLLSGSSTVLNPDLKKISRSTFEASRQVLMRLLCQRDDLVFVPIGVCSDVYWGRLFVPSLWNSTEQQPSQAVSSTIRPAPELVYNYFDDLLFLFCSSATEHMTIADFLEIGVLLGFLVSDVKAASMKAMRGYLSKIDADWEQEMPELQGRRSTNKAALIMHLIRAAAVYGYYRIQKAFRNTPNQNIRVIHNL